MISIKSSFNRSSLIVNRFLKFYFVVIIMRVFIIFIKFITLMVKSVIAFISSIFRNLLK